MAGLSRFGHPQKLRCLASRKQIVVTAKFAWSGCGVLDEPCPKLWSEVRRDRHVVLEAALRDQDVQGLRLQVDVAYTDGRQFARAKTGVDRDGEHAAVAGTRRCVHQGEHLRGTQSEPLPLEDWTWAHVLQ